MFDKNQDYGVCDAVAKEGSNLMAALFDASIQKSMSPLGGCNSVDIINFPVRWHKLIEAYLKNEIDAVTACYVAMRNLDAEINYDK